MDWDGLFAPQGFVIAALSYLILGPMVARSWGGSSEEEERKAQAKKEEEARLLASLPEARRLEKLRHEVSLLQDLIRGPVWVEGISHENLLAYERMVLDNLVERVKAPKALLRYPRKGEGRSMIREVTEHDQYRITELGKMKALFPPEDADPEL